MDVQTTLAGNIQRIIRERGLKQCFVAERAGFNPNAFSNMLNGRKTIRAEYIPIIANALGVTANDLYRVSDSERVKVVSEAEARVWQADMDYAVGEKRGTGAGD